MLPLIINGQSSLIIGNPLDSHFISHASRPRAFRFLWRFSLGRFVGFDGPESLDGVRWHAGIVVFFFSKRRRYRLEM